MGSVSGIIRCPIVELMIVVLLKSSRPVIGRQVEDR